MEFEYIPLLQQQRDLYRLPRDMKRFRTYLNQMIDWDSEDMRLPLFSMNPMAKDHVPAFLDDLLAFDADGLAARAVAEAGPPLGHLGGEYKVCLVVADDIGGGWTNRYSCEYSHRFESGRLYERGWLIGLLWVSDPPSEQTVREEILTSVHRLAYIRQHGAARTLRERMAQEGYAMALAGSTGPTLGAEDSEYTREVLTPSLGATDLRTTVECLFGDAAGGTLGFSPCGLSARAGLALALHEARAAATAPGANHRVTEHTNT